MCAATAAGVTVGMFNSSQGGFLSGAGTRALWFLFALAVMSSIFIFVAAQLATTTRERWVTLFAGFWIAVIATECFRELRRRR